MKVQRLIFIDHVHNTRRVQTINDVVTLRPDREIEPDAMEALARGEAVKVDLIYCGLHIHGRMLPANAPSRREVLRRREELRSK